MTHQKYKHMHNTGTVSQAVAQWSSPAWTSHTVYMDVLHTGSTSCALQIHGIWCSLQDGIDRWSISPIFFWHALTPSMSDFNTGTMSQATEVVKTHGIWCSLHQSGMDRWSTFPLYFSTCTSTLTKWLQHMNCESGKERYHRGGRLFRAVPSPLVNHFWINIWRKNTSIRAASDLWHDIWYLQTDRHFIQQLH